MAKMRKYLQTIAGLTPLIILILYIYLSHTVPGFAYVEWVLLAIGLIVGIAAYLNTVKIMRNVASGNDLPLILADFPIYETTEDEYRQTRQKMEAFILSVEAGQSVQIALSADELNCLSTKGKTPSRSAWSLPEYYGIRDGKVYGDAITVVPFVSCSGYWSFGSEIEFVRGDEGFSEIGHLIERNGKPRSPKKSPQRFSTRLFTAILCLDQTPQWSNSARTVLTQLQAIEVIDEQLILRA
jgi:hypothetical protein